MTPEQIRTIYQANQTLEHVTADRLRKAKAYFKEVANHITRHPADFTVQYQIDNNNLIGYLDSLIKERELADDVCWKNTLCPDYARHGFISDFCIIAQTLGYPYFVWGGWIYTSKDGKRTGLLREHLK